MHLHIDRHVTLPGFASGSSSVADSLSPEMHPGFVDRALDGFLGRDLRSRERERESVEEDGEWGREHSGL